ncbi:MAG: hypothetical protein WBQ79_09955, partial [Acidobacteriaceae bacterium]
MLDIKKRFIDLNSASGRKNTLARKGPGWRGRPTTAEKAYRAENCSCRALGISPLKRELLIA